MTDDTASRWPDIRIIGPIEHRRGIRYSGLVEVEVPLSRPTVPEWDVLFEEALKFDPDGREAAGIRAQMVPMIWATVMPVRAETIDRSIEEAVEVANLRYRTQRLPTLPAFEVEALVDDALSWERRHPPAS
jgi:hypothetical protein